MSRIRRPGLARLRACAATISDDPDPMSSTKDRKHDDVDATDDVVGGRESDCVGGYPEVREVLEGVGVAEEVAHRSDQRGGRHEQADESEPRGGALERQSLWLSALRRNRSRGVTGLGGAGVRRPVAGVAEGATAGAALGGTRICGHVRVFHGRPSGLIAMPPSGQRRVNGGPPGRMDRPRHLDQ